MNFVNNTDMSAPERETNDPASLAFLERDTRNVFGAQGLLLSACVRKRVQRLGIPVMMQAQLLLKSGLDKDRCSARALLEESLPRDTGDLLDQRYFGVLWTLGRIAKDEGRHIDALEQFITAIEDFPSAARAEHYLAIATLLRENFGLSESYAAAVLHRGIRALAPRVQPQTLEKITQAFAGLEVSGNGTGRRPFSERLPIGAKGATPEAGKLLGRGAAD